MNGGYTVSYTTKRIHREKPNLQISLWLAFGAIISALRSAGYSPEEIRSNLNVGLTSYEKEKAAACSASLLTESLECPKHPGKYGDH